MSDLQISAPTLLRVGAQISSVAPTVRFESTLVRPEDNSLQSPLVAAALSAGANQQAQRAALTAPTLEQLGRFTADAVEQYLAVDFALASRAG